MRTVGIIVEYNPLHNGHVYHCQQARRLSKADAVVAVMSGHFLQRGEPALTNKWARTEMALSMGVDLVIELPVAYSAQPAEWFAYGAVSALHLSGIVDSLCFGSESGDIAWFSELADLLADEPEVLQKQLHARLKQGLNYPQAYTRAVQYVLRSEGIGAAGCGTDDAYDLAKPNNTLGLHYMIALRRLGSSIAPLTIKRVKAGYHDPLEADAQIASATAIREKLLVSGDLAAIQPYIPHYTAEILQREWDAGRAPVHWERLAVPLMQAILSRSKEELAALAEVSEGLENRILRALNELEGSCSVEQLIEGCKTKRYTRTKLQRTFTRILLGHRKELLTRDVLAQGVPYLRILGFSRIGRQLLKQMKQTASVPIITNVGQEVHPLMLLDIQATGIHALGYQHFTAHDLLRDYYEPPLILQQETSASEEVPAADAAESGSL